MTSPVGMMKFPTEWNNNKCSKPQTNYNILYISIRRILPACIIHSQHMVRSCLSGLGWYPQSLGPGKQKTQDPSGFVSNLMNKSWCFMVFRSNCLALLGSTFRYIQQSLVLFREHPMDHHLNHREPAAFRPSR